VHEGVHGRAKVAFVMNPTPHELVANVAIPGAGRLTDGGQPCACLESAIGLADDLVIVDTGSRSLSWDTVAAGRDTTDTP